MPKQNILIHTLHKTAKCSSWKIDLDFVADVFSSIAQMKKRQQRLETITHDEMLRH